MWSLASRARFVVAVGTCASFGGVGSEGEVEATGLQFSQWKEGGFLGADYRLSSGMPVVNLPGCPIYPEPVLSTLAALIMGPPVELDEFAAGELVRPAGPPGVYPQRVPRS